MHDSESQMDADNCADPGCYSIKIKYVQTTERQMSALAELSSECHQSIRVRLLNYVIFLILYYTRF